MDRSLRSILIPVALIVAGGCAAAAGSCASKTPQPESAATTAPPEPEPVRTSAGGGASADPSSAGSTGSVTAGTGAQTPDERRAALDKRLNDSLDSFDAQLRREQQKIAQERDGRQATVTTVAASAGSARPDPDPNAQASSGNAPTDLPERPSGSHRGAPEPGAGRAGDLKSDKSGGGANASGNGAVATEVPDGNDDDVVARRLRKAAEQETDPELKEKLWKEYVEYKKNTQGK
jgi:hypothetical protein